MKVSIVEEGSIVTVLESGANTIIILGQLELIAVVSMLDAAVDCTNGKLSHDLAGFAGAIAEPIKAELSNAMAGIAGEYHESEEFSMPAEMQEKVDEIMARVFGGKSGEMPNKSTEQNDGVEHKKRQQSNQGEVLPGVNSAI